jgi:CHASE2 domain-containing sensor protein
MGWFKAIWSEFIGLFVDDGSLAIAILLWLAACWLLFPRLPLPPAIPPMILFLGMVLILVESAFRRSREGS